MEEILVVGGWIWNGGLIPLYGLCINGICINVAIIIGYFLLS